MAFLRYRREVVSGWPESPRRAVFLAGIERRIATLEGRTEARVLRVVHSVPRAKAPHIITAAA